MRDVVPPESAVRRELGGPTRGLALVPAFVGHSLLKSLGEFTLYDIGRGAGQRFLAGFRVVIGARGLLRSRSACSRRPLAPLRNLDLLRFSHFTPLQGFTTIADN